MSVPNIPGGGGKHMLWKVLAMTVGDEGQPALMNLVPCTLGTVMSVGVLMVGGRLSADLF